MSDKITYKGINPSDITEISLSGGFLSRIQGVYFNYMKFVGTENFEKIMPNLRDNTVGDISDEDLKVQAFDIQTLLILMTEIEKAFDEKGLIIDSEVELPNED